MFVDAKARSERTTDAALRTAIEHHSTNYDNWFDGTMDSVEKRIRSAKKVSQFAESAYARTGSTKYLSTIADAQAEQQGLRDLQASLVTGGMDREAEGNPYDNPGHHSNPGWEQVSGGPEGYVHTFKDPYGGGIWVSKSDHSGKETHRKFHPTPRQAPQINPYLSLESQGFPGGKEAAWVEKEAHLFVGDNREADRDEMYIRAKGHIEHVTSAMPVRTAAALSQAFVGRCMQLHTGPVTHRVAAAPTAPADFDSALLYLA